MKRLLAAAVVMAAAVSARAWAEEAAPAEAKRAAEGADGSNRIAPPDEAERPAPADREVRPDPSPDRPLENREWRSLFHTASQVRQATVAFMIVLASLASILTLGALIVFTAGIAPNATARASMATRDRPLRSFVVGALALGAGTLATAATHGVLGFLLLPIFTAAVLIGLAGVSEQIGRNLWHLSGKEGHRVGHLCAGWGVFSLVSLVPFVGWFGFFPYYCAVGVGSFFSTILGGRREPAQEYRGL